MKVNYYMDCCGVKELSMLSNYPNPEMAMRALGSLIYPDPEKNKLLVDTVRARAIRDGVSSATFGYMGVQIPYKEAHVVYQDLAQYSRFRFAVFSEAHRPGLTEEAGPKYGQNFAAFIRECGLGEVIETGRALNPNSGNNLKVWVWTVNHAALIEWLKKDAKKNHKAQPSVSLFAGGAERWAGNQGSNVTGTVPTVEGLGGSLPQNCEYTATCAPAPPRQG